MLKSGLLMANQIWEFLYSYDDDNDHNNNIINNNSNNDNNNNNSNSNNYDSNDRKYESFFLSWEIREI